jgi:hypothetical protein
MPLLRTKSSTFFTSSGCSIARFISDFFDVCTLVNSVPADIQLFTTCISKQPSLTTGAGTTSPITLPFFTNACITLLALLLWRKSRIIEIRLKFEVLLDGELLD